MQWGISLAIMNYQKNSHKSKLGQVFTFSCKTKNMLHVHCTWVFVFNGRLGKQPLTINRSTAQCSWWSRKLANCFTKEILMTKGKVNSPGSLYCYCQKAFPYLNCYLWWKSNFNSQISFIHNFTRLTRQNRINSGGILKIGKVFNSK